MILHDNENINMTIIIILILVWFAPKKSCCFVHWVLLVVSNTDNRYLACNHYLMNIHREVVAEQSLVVDRPKIPVPYIVVAAAFAASWAARDAWPALDGLLVDFVVQHCFETVENFPLRWIVQNFPLLWIVGNFPMWTF